MLWLETCAWLRGSVSLGDRASVWNWSKVHDAVTVKLCGNYITKNDRPLTRVFGDKNCKRFIESMQTENWQALYTPDVDWYKKFINVIEQKFETCFPMIRVSRKRLKDRPWITAGLKPSIKKSHRLYRTTLQDSCHHMKSKYKKYRAILSLKVAEQNYYCQLFDDTKQSAYNLWKKLGSSNKS